MKKLISIMTACYNEEENIREVYEQVKKVFDDLPEYRYEHLFIDNASEDKTVEILKDIAEQDENVKVIVNARNFGHIRSPFHGLLQCQGNAVISIVADLQDPPEMIKTFLQKWEAGYKIVVGVKPQSKESKLMFCVRKLYYRIISIISETKIIRNFTGFGLYDRSVIQELERIDDPYPYFRGLISELGYKTAEIPYTQPARKHGTSKNNFYSLYDMAMTGITSHTKVPIRLATILGFSLSVISFIMAIVFFILKLIFWEHYTVGIAPILIGLFFFSSVQLFFIGLLGEYIASIHTQVKKRPLVIERERVNFD